MVYFLVNLFYTRILPIVIEEIEALKEEKARPHKGIRRTENKSQLENQGFLLPICDAAKFSHDWPVPQKRDLERRDHASEPRHSTPKLWRLWLRPWAWSSWMLVSYLRTHLYLLEAAGARVVPLDCKGNQHGKFRSHLPLIPSPGIKRVKHMSYQTQIKQRDFFFPQQNWVLALVDGRDHIPQSFCGG